MRLSCYGIVRARVKFMLVFCAENLLKITLEVYLHPMLTNSCSIMRLNRLPRAPRAPWNRFGLPGLPGEA